VNQFTRRPRRRHGAGARLGTFAATAALSALSLAAPVAAQDLADFDYENLSFRGVAVEWGYLWPSKVETDPTFGVRFDLGYLGPSVRLTPSITYWESQMTTAEVRTLEARVEELANRGRPVVSEPVTIDLGRIMRRDLALGLDGHVVWSIPLGLLSYAGAGVSAHLLNGSGEAVDGTFVEDLLDSVSAGINLHAGLEYPVNSRLRFYTSGRHEWLGDLRWFELRVGTQVMFGPSLPGELR
jgi:opacity protein-like surface antigen